MMIWHSGIALCGKDGMNVPEDISITASTIQHPRMSKPAITSLHHDMYELGAECAKILIEEIQTGKHEKRDYKLDYYIVKRESVKDIGNKQQKKTVRSFLLRYIHHPVAFRDGTVF
jgi:DNA-binding LacI/PurR family transcriptional regulator